MSAIALISPFIPYVIKGLEKLLPSKDGKKMGPMRMESGIGILQALIAQLAGTVPGGQVAKPQEDEIRAAIESVFQNLKTSGDLATDTPVAAAYYIVRGPIVALP